MAHRTSTRQKLILPLLLITVLMVGACGSTSGSTRVRPKKHFLSWESTNAHDKMRPWRNVARPEREFVAKRRKVVRLKKPSFIDRKPVQFATPAVQGVRLYVGSNAGMFYAVDIVRNRKVWDISTEGGVESPAAVSGDSVYVGDIKGYAYSFDAEAGKINWKMRLGNEVLGAPLVVGNRVYFVTLDGRLFALDRSTGAEIWHTDAMERQVGFTVRRQSSPAYYKGMIIYGTSRGTLVAYREDASLAWVRSLGAPYGQVVDVDCRPLVIDNLLYATSAEGQLHCLDPRSGAILWSVKAGGVNDLLYHGGMLYATGEGVLSAVEPASGTVLWEQNLETAEISSPAGGDNYVAVMSTKDKLYLIDQKSGDIVFERYVRRGSYGDPIVVGDTLYVLANTSRLFSFKIHEKEKKPKKKS